MANKIKLNFDLKKKLRTEIKPRLTSTEVLDFTEYDDALSKHGMLIKCLKGRGNH